MPSDLNAPIESYADGVSREYPAAVKQPCSECPWRRDSWAGYLGPHTPQEWIAIAHGEQAVACHKTIPDGGGWGEQTHQCRGAAIFRANVGKLPHNPTIETGPADRDTVFAKNAEFIDHHAEGEDFRR